VKIYGYDVPEETVLIIRTRMLSASFLAGDIQSLAEHLGVPPGTSEALVHHMIRKLRVDESIYREPNSIIWRPKTCNPA